MIDTESRLGDDFFFFELCLCVGGGKDLSEDPDKDGLPTIFRGWQEPINKQNFSPGSWS